LLVLVPLLLLYVQWTADLSVLQYWVVLLLPRRTTSPAVSAAATAGCRCLHCSAHVECHLLEVICHTSHSNLLHVVPLLLLHTVLLLLLLLAHELLQELRA
jgi:hypothetical protein